VLAEWALGPLAQGASTASALGESDENLARRLQAQYDSGGLATAWVSVVNDQNRNVSGLQRLSWCCCRAGATFVRVRKASSQQLCSCNAEPRTSGPTGIAPVPAHPHGGTRDGRPARTVHPIGERSATNSPSACFGFFWDWGLALTDLVCCLRRCCHHRPPQPTGCCRLQPGEVQACRNRPRHRLPTHLRRRCHPTCQRGGRPAQRHTSSTVIAGGQSFRLLRVPASLL
jgi:hypothetical protein